MNFVFTEEQEALRATARAFLAEHSSSEHVRRAMASELGYDAALWKRMAGELGWSALLVPEAHGGLGLGFVEMVALLEVTGEALLCAPLLSSACLGASALLVAGDEQQKKDLLPGIAEGRTRATLAHTEAGAAWAPDAVQTRARRERSGYVLDGSKRYVPDGGSADLLIVTARSETGLGLFAVRGDAPGVSRRVLPTLDATRRLAAIELRGVRVAASARLGGEGDAAAALARVLDLAAVALGAEQVGGAQRCLELAVCHARQRIQFGRPIGSFQAIKHKCADMLVAVESARSASYWAACVADEDAAELGLVASAAKATCSETYFRCAAECLQIHGGVGFTWEYDVHLHLKRARAGESLFGTPAEHRERVATRIGL